MKNSSLKPALLIFVLLSFFPVHVVAAGDAPAVSQELHWAVTPEKFELALARLRAGNKPRHALPIVLAHGLFVGSQLFNLDEDHSLAQYLAKEGFDVWNLSLRGTGRSLNPLKGVPKEWSLDDMIDKDLPVVVRYVQKESRSPRVIWVGYEMGGLLAYGYLEKKGASGVAAVVAIGAPTTFNSPDQAPTKTLLRLDESPTLKKIFLALNSTFFGKLIVPLVPTLEQLFYNRDNMEEPTKEKLLAETLVDINPGVLNQLLLALKRDEFVSARGNVSYRKNLSKIGVPILLIGGEADSLAPPQAMRAIYRDVTSSDRTLRIFGPRSKDSAAYGHIDLLLGTKAKDEVFPVIGRWLQQRAGGR